MMRPSRHPPSATAGVAVVALALVSGVLVRPVEGALFARRPTPFAAAGCRHSVRGARGAPHAVAPALATVSPRGEPRSPRHVFLGVLPAVAYGGLAATTIVAASLLVPILSGPGALALIGGTIGIPAATLAAQVLGPSGGRIARSMGGVPAGAELVALAREAASAVGVPEPKAVYSIPAREANAFATGLRGNTAVAVTQGLVDSLSERELKAVLAHEMGHLKHKDVGRNMHVAIAAAGLGGVFRAGQGLLRVASQQQQQQRAGGAAPRSARARDERGETDEPASPGALTGVAAALCVAGLTTQAMAHALRLGASRAAELEADRAAAEAFGADALISALQKISQGARTHADLRNSALGSSMAHVMISNGPGAAPVTADAPPTLNRLLGRARQLLSTHPSLEVRVAALRAIR